MSTTVSTTPLVSIGIPTYDRPEMLGMALRSAIEQTYEHLEILVADDGSNPETEAVVREVAAGDSRVTYERNERNLGGVGNGIKVLRWASGEFQKMLLDDDLLRPHFVETMLEPMLAEPTFAMAFSKRDIIDQDGRLLPDPPGMSAIANQAGRVPAQSLIHLCASTTTNWIGEQSTVLYRSSVVNHDVPFQLAGGACSGVMGDLSMHLSALARGDAWYTPEPLSSFRQHEGQYSNDQAIHLIALGDWVTFCERLHLIGQPLGTVELIQNFGRFIATLGQNLAVLPDAPEADAAQEVLERAVAHLRSLREEATLRNLLRASIVLTARGAAPHLLPQLEAIIAATPPDAFEVIIVLSEPSGDVRGLVGSLEGDVQILETNDPSEALELAREHARNEWIVPLGEDARPARGWLADLLDEQLVRELDAAAQ